MFRPIRKLLQSLTGALRQRRDLLLEHLALRQQIAVLERSAKRPRFTTTDRLFWIVLSRCWDRWPEVLEIVAPESPDEAKKMGIPSIAAIHGSPWTYDTYVPIFFAGPGVPEGVKVSRRVSPSDVAPTIAAYLGIKPPSGSMGELLPQVLGQ